MIPQELLLKPDVRRIAVRRRLERGFSRDQGPEPCGLYRRRAVFIQRAVAIGPVLRGIQLDQHVALLDDLAVLHMDSSDKTGLELLDDRLDDLGVPAGNDLALGRSHDVDPAEIGPQNRGREHGQDRPENRPADGRRRRLLDLQHGRQKFHGLARRHGPRQPTGFGLPGRPPERRVAPEIHLLSLVLGCRTAVLCAQRLPLTLPSPTVGRGLTCGYPHCEPPLLMCVQPGIETVLLQQVVVCAFFDDLALLDGVDAVSGPHRAEPVRDDDHRATLAHLGHVLLDNRFRFVVEGARRLVENENTGVRHEGACDSDPLPLPAGERATVFAHQRVIALRELEDEVMGAGELGRLDDAIHRERGIGQRDVVPHGAVEQKVLLQHDAHLPLQPGRIHLREIHPHRPAPSPVPGHRAAGSVWR